MTLLQQLIASARQQADTLMAQNSGKPENEQQKAAQLIAQARAQSQQDWADFAERGAAKD